MKKISIILLALLFLLSGTIITALAADVVTCTIPKDEIFSVFYFPMGMWVGMQVVEDTRITVVKLHKDQPHPDDPNIKRDIVQFSLAYDKPKIFCKTHGVDTYDMYGPSVLDEAFIFKEKLVGCSNES